ncbi:cobalamin biosynthesis protein [Actinoplanes rectilineatus]|uniref:cobalamin biosynthesis protein n=1 Tax=Actinoplanes rectilineatus TaxID=113571 RepID=UPI0005F2833A|nr:cobalamin biosynthesis protein [Actinoplanes rectilineatus]
MFLGLGARAGTCRADLSAAVAAALRTAGLAPEAVTVLATLDRRAAEEPVRLLARELGWRLVGYPAAALGGRTVPGPSAAVLAAVGTPSVAEAAALRAAGVQSRLILPKQVFARVTVAIAIPRPGGDPTICEKHSESRT